jgi:hypothetical protein
MMVRLREKQERPMKIVRLGDGYAVGVAEVEALDLTAGIRKWFDSVPAERFVDPAFRANTVTVFNNATLEDETYAAID